MTNQNFLNSTYRNKLKTKIQVFDQSESVFFNTCFDKNQLKSLIAWFLEKYGEKITVDFLETLKQVGFHQATLAGVSLGVDDLQIPAQKSLLLSQALVKIGELRNANNAGNITSVEKSQRLIDTWNQTSEILRQTAVQNFRITNPVNPVFMMAFSGARGNISQVRQLVAMRGLMADPQGAILEFPIQSNFREGLTITEYLISCYGARKGLVDTALRTATSGYLTRRLVDAVQHVVVVMTDCKTKRGILIKNKNLEQRLVGRVLLEDIALNSTTIIEKNTLISQKLAKKLALKHKEIYVRSPLTCNTEKSVCQLCYGLNLAQGKLVSIGEAVGVIAAQSIGEPGTQLTMRTFHTGGVGVFSDQAMKSFNAPFDGKIEFLENLSGLFVRTPHGNIVYLLKYSENQTKKPILRLKPVNSTQEFYEILQCDVPAGSLLWVKQGEYVKTGQLLVQASQIKTSKQQMPESSHPVQAPYSGEVFFESMIIRVIRKQTQLKAKKVIKKEDEISPKFRTLTELGNFWIFSSGVQKESSLAKSFFVKGDLLSLDTPVFQYNLTIPKKGQLKRLNSCLVLGQNCFEFLISKTYYSKLLYFLIKSDSKNQNNIIVYNNNPKKALVTWYPTLKNLNIRQSGYYFTIGNGTHLLSQKIVDFNEGTGLSGPLFETQPSFFWTENPLFTFTNFNYSLPSSCFLFNNSCSLLSTKGIFQIQAKEKIKWSKKSRFSNKFFKNFSQITQIGDKKRWSEKYIFEKSTGNVSDFIKKSLNLCQKTIVSKNQTRLIQKKQTWFYIPEKQIQKFIPSKITSVILEPGKSFEKISFLKSFVSVNFFQVEKISFLKSQRNKKSNYNFYSISTLLNLKNCPKNQISLNETKFNKNKLILVNFSRQFVKEFSFYERKLDLKSLNLKNKIKYQIENIIFFQKTSHQFIPDIKFFKQNWFLQQSIPVNFSTKSPLFTKQFTTVNKEQLLLQTCLKITTPTFSDWVSGQNLIKIEITFKTASLNEKNKFRDKNMFLSTSLSQQQISFSKFKSNFKISLKNTRLLFTGFSFFFYNSLKLQNSRQFSLETFENSWVLPEFKITQAFIKSKQFGEFRHLQINQNSNSFSVLRNTDLSTFQLPLNKIKMKSLQIGTIVRWGQEIFPEFAIPISGQILKITSKTLTIRKGIPILASGRGVVHVFNNDLILKNDLLITLKSRRLQTEDIVQGIPKIEQLFEARETQGGEILTNSAHTKLQSFFRAALQFKPLRLAVNQSIHQIQNYLVENILDAYSNQGVKISEKHVEIVVRQMTARVRILSGGDSGLLPGEIVQLKWVERVNNQLSRVGSREASYEPMILGITKSVLQSESFLVAASFQEVSRVLVRSALTKKTDFLRGLHENVILGQLIPAGTGVISRASFDQNQISPIQKSETGPSDTNMFLNSE